MSHKPVRPSRPPKRGLKAVNSLLTPFYSVIDADSAEPGRYAPRESLRYAIVPDLQPEPKAVAFTCSDELAFKIANFLSAEHAKNNPPCAGCAAFGPPVWEGEIAGKTGNLGSTEGWYHYTGGIHPFKDKYVWCVAMNVSKEDLPNHTSLDDEVLVKQEGSLGQLADSIGRHYAAMHEFPKGDYRKKFIEEVREIQEDIRGWTIPPSDARTYGTGMDDVVEKADVKQAPVTMDKAQVEFQLKCVAGRILTLVDAMVTSEAQNKAFKTYVKKEFREQFNRIFHAFHDQGGATSLPEELAVAEAAFN